MANSVVQTLFDDALDGLTPVKSCTAFLDSDACMSPMMEYFLNKPKLGNNTTTSKEATEAKPR